MFRSSIFDIRIFAALVLLAAFTATGRATAMPENTPVSPAITHYSLDGTDCVASSDSDEAPLQLCEDTSDPRNDLDEISLPSDDKAVIPSRGGQATPNFTPTTVDGVALRQPGIVPAFLFSIQLSNSLREHILERAPPSLV